MITTTPRRHYTTTPWCIFIKTKRFDIRVKLRSKNYCQEVSETLFLFFHYLLFLFKVFDIENLKLIQNFTADENPICTLAVGNQMLFSGSLKSIKVGGVVNLSIKITFYSKGSKQLMLKIEVKSVD